MTFATFTRKMLAVGGIVLLASACADGPTVPQDGPDARSFKRDKDVTVGDISLSVTFSGGRVTNDMSAPYVHRVDGVQAELEARYDRLWFKTFAKGKKPAIPRTVCFDFNGAIVGEPINGASDPLAGTTLCADVLWHTRNNLFDGGIGDLQEGESGFTGGKFLWSEANAEYFLVYDCGTGVVPLTSCDESHVTGEGFLVTRENATTWTIEPGPDTIAELWMVTADSPKTLIATYDMPFFATLTEN